jgi:hypothetical protein
MVAACLGGTSGALAQPVARHTLQVNGQALQFEVRSYPADAKAIDPAVQLEPVTPLDTAKLLHRFLTAGKIEDAALLSNAPRRRFEVFRDYQASVGEDGFREVFTEYFKPANRLLAEILMGPHSLLVWQLSERSRYVGQYYVKVEDKVLLDDVPNETRARLRQVLEAIRSGQLVLPAL